MLIRDDMAGDQINQSPDGPGADPMLDLGQIGALFSALSVYGMEADACYDAGAYLASCIMLGAGIEGYLLLLISLFTEQAFQTRAAKKLKHKNILKWDLGELLQVARDLNWLPSEVSNALSGDEIRKLRNLIHPGRLVKDYSGRTIDKQKLDALHATCFEIYMRLSQKAESSVPKPRVEN
jgi:hypothetical protein